MGSSHTVLASGDDTFGDALIVLKFLRNDLFLKLVFTCDKDQLLHNKRKRSAKWLQKHEGWTFSIYIRNPTFNRRLYSLFSGCCRIECNDHSGIMQQRIGKVASFCRMPLDLKYRSPSSSPCSLSHRQTFYFCFLDNLKEIAEPLIHWFQKLGFLSKWNKCIMLAQLLIVTVSLLNNFEYWFWVKLWAQRNNTTHK